MDEAQGEPEVVALGGLDVGDAPAVAPDPHLAGETGDVDRPRLLRQRPLQEAVPERPAGERR